MKSKDSMEVKNKMEGGECLGDFQAQQYNTKAHVDRPQTPYRKAIPKSSLWERTLNSSSHQKPETVLSSGG